MPLVFVPTPLGNLGDITLRSVETLRACDIVAAEDTRVALRLLSALEIFGKPIWSYREQIAERATANILDAARSKIVAVVSDAGTPGISDPGRDLIVAARDAGIAVDVLPGPTAFVGAAVLSGFETSSLLFIGFVPRNRRERRAILTMIVERGGTTVFYESPNRIRATLDDLDEIAPHVRIFLLREYTKRFEQQVLGRPSAVRDALEESPRGEIAVVVEGAPRIAGTATPSADDIGERIDALLAQGTALSEIAKLLSEGRRELRNSIYRRASARKRELDGVR